MGGRGVGLGVRDGATPRRWPICCGAEAFAEAAVGVGPPGARELRRRLVRGPRWPWRRPSWLSVPRRSRRCLSWHSGPRQSRRCLSWLSAPRRSRRCLSRHSAQRSCLSSKADLWRCFGSAGAADGVGFLGARGWRRCRGSRASTVEAATQLALEASMAAVLRLWRTRRGLSWLSGTGKSRRRPSPLSGPRWPWRGERRRGARVPTRKPGTASVPTRDRRQ